MDRIIASKRAGRENRIISRIVCCSLFVGRGRERERERGDATYPVTGPPDRTELFSKLCSWCGVLLTQSRRRASNRATRASRARKKKLSKNAGVIEIWNWKLEIGNGNENFDKNTYFLPLVSNLWVAPIMSKFSCF